VFYDPKANEDGFCPSVISGGDHDFIEAAKKHGEWNRWAAYASAVAAALQGISMLFQIVEPSLQRM
jgi:hypothetical protein